MICLISMVHVHSLYSKGKALCLQVTNAHHRLDGNLLSTNKGFSLKCLKQGLLNVQFSIDKAGFHLLCESGSHEYIDLILTCKKWVLNSIYPIMRTNWLSSFVTGLFWCCDLMGAWLNEQLCQIEWKSQSCGHLCKIKNYCAVDFNEPACWIGLTVHIEF